MEDYKKFNYKNYLKLVKIHSRNLPLMNYEEINNRTEKFLIIRHDVDYSVDRALKMAKLENDNGVSSTYFFQIRNNSYNIQSSKNIDIVKSIYRMGHKIGLHVHMGGHNKELISVEDYIKNDLAVLSNYIDYDIKCFSFHRPSIDLLKKNISIPGFINAYSEMFFDLTEDFNNARIRYFADSNHNWKYGNPFNNDNFLLKKIHLLIHPDNWSENGFNNEENFNDLINEKTIEIKMTFNEESNSFPYNLL